MPSTLLNPKPDPFAHPIPMTIIPLTFPLRHLSALLATSCFILACKWLYSLTFRPFSPVFVFFLFQFLRLQFGPNFKPQARNMELQRRAFPAFVPHPALRISHFCHLIFHLQVPDLPQTTPSFTSFYLCIIQFSPAFAFLLIPNSALRTPHLQRSAPRPDLL